MHTYKVSLEYRVFALPLGLVLTLAGPVLYLRDAGALDTEALVLIGAALVYWYLCLTTPHTLVFSGDHEVTVKSLVRTREYSGYKLRSVREGRLFFTLDFGHGRVLVSTLTQPLNSVRAALKALNPDAEYERTTRGLFRGWYK